MEGENIHPRGKHKTPEPKCIKDPKTDNTFGRNLKSHHKTHLGVLQKKYLENKIKHLQKRNNKDLDP